MDKVSKSRSQGNDADESSGEGQDGLVVHRAECGDLESGQVSKTAARPVWKLDGVGPVDNRPSTRVYHLNQQPWYTSYELPEYLVAYSWVNAKN